MKTIRRRRSIVTERYASTVIRLEPSLFRICPGCDECGNVVGENDPDALALSTGSFNVRRTQDGTMILCPGKREIKE